MAGIGFELKKMFSKKGILSMLKAYGYAGIVCTGPMLLGLALLLGTAVIGRAQGAGEWEVELLNSMITYTLVFSMFLTNTFSLVTTRYTADQLYMKHNSKILPSFFGSVGSMLVPGCLLYAVFLFVSGIPALYQLMVLVLFGELILVWTQMNYLTAIKDYRGILTSFAAALLCAWLLAWLLLEIGVAPVPAMLFAVCAAYGIMAVRYYVLLLRYFPEGRESAFHFLAWFDLYPQLSFLGLFLSLGLFGHLIIMWTSPARVQILGLFYGAPMYDVPALLAFLSILATTIHFVTSVEVNFYPKYRNYFSLFNDGGSFVDIRQAEREMKATLVQELVYTYMKQFFVTIVFILAGTFLLPYLPLGVDADMLGIYRVLCVGYAFYAIGNCAMLIQLYFADNKGALVSGTVFMAVSCAVTTALKGGSTKLYGVGFLAGSVCFAVTALFLLWRYLKRLMYHVLCSQPMIAEKRKGWLSGFSEKMAERYREKYPEFFSEETEEEEH